MNIDENGSCIDDLAVFHMVMLHALSYQSSLSSVATLNRPSYRFQLDGGLEQSLVFHIIIGYSHPN